MGLMATRQAKEREHAAKEWQKQNPLSGTAVPPSEGATASRSSSDRRGELLSADMPDRRGDLQGVEVVAEDQSRASRLPGPPIPGLDPPQLRLPIATPRMPAQLPHSVIASGGQPGFQRPMMVRT